MLTFVCIFVLALLVLLKYCDHISWGREMEWAVICDCSTWLTFLLTIFSLLVCVCVCMGL